jgi:rhodanese-related sulfurtransferase
VFCFRRPAYALVRRHWGRFRGAHLWFDLDDIESVALAGAAALHPPPSLEGRLVARLAVWRNRRAEDRMLDVADTVSVCSAVDRERLRVRRPRASIAVLPNVVSLPPAVPDRVADGTFCVLFVGSMSYGPNEDAALWLAREVLPVLRDRCSQPVTLQLVGRRPRPADARPLTIVDVREPELFAEGHIPGAINRPWPGVKATAATELSKDHAIVLVCHGGPMGDELADILVAAGFTDVRNLEGGMRQWRGPIVPGG